MFKLTDEQIGLFRVKKDRGIGSKASQSPVVKFLRELEIAESALILKKD